MMRRLVVARHSQLVRYCATTKEYSEIPGPPTYPFIGCLPDFLKSGGDFSTYSNHLYRNYGPISKFNLFGIERVAICDPLEYRNKIFAAEGSTPRGAASFLWPFGVYFGERGGAENSVLFAENAEWRQIRTILQTKFFSPTDAEQYLLNMQKTLDQVSENAPHWGQRMDVFTARLGTELISNVMFNINLGAITPQVHPEDEEFIVNVMAIFVAMNDLLFSVTSPLHKRFYKLSPKYKKFEVSLDRALKRSMHLLDRVKEGIVEAERTGQPNFSTSSYYGAMLAQHGDKMTDVFIAHNIGTLYFAGVDTTSNTLQWLLYNLATNQAAQDRLAAELKAVLKGNHLTPETANQVQFLNQCIKESFRVTPTASGTVRWTKDDTVVLGFKVPKGTMVQWTSDMARAEGIFEEPMKFKPERFDEEARKNRPSDVSAYYDHGFFTSNFGFGPRMCLGARVAQTEVRAVISRLVQDYVITLDPPHQDIKPILRTLTTPVPSPKLKFTLRH